MSIEKVLIPSETLWSEYLQRRCRGGKSHDYATSVPKSFPCIAIVEHVNAGVMFTRTIINTFVYPDEFKEVLHVMEAEPAPSPDCAVKSA